jgi:hypothetical protein
MKSQEFQNAYYGQFSQFGTILKRKFKQQWLTILPISTKRTTGSYLKLQYTKTPRHMALEIQVLDSCVKIVN